MYFWQERDKHFHSPVSMENRPTPSSASLRSASGPVWASEECGECKNQEIAWAAPTSGVRNRRGGGEQRTKVRCLYSSSAFGPGSE